MVISEFLDYIKYELCRSEKTVEGYAEDLESFEAYFQDLPGQLSWETVDSDVVRNWVESMMDKGNTATSVNRRLSALHSFFRFALARNMVEKDPSHGVRGPKKVKPLPVFLKEDQMDELLDRQRWGDGYADVLARTVIVTFYETGMRLAELVALNDESVRFVNREIKVTGKEINNVSYLLAMNWK